MTVGRRRQKYYSAAEVERMQAEVTDAKKAAERAEQQATRGDRR